MKKLSVLVLITTCFITSSQAAEVVAANNSGLSQLCVTAAAGNIAVMYNKIKASGYSHPFIAKNIQCNGENIISFIRNNGKNSDAMIRSLERLSSKVTITAQAKNSLDVK
jgi:hypothetical protein